MTEQPKPVINVWRLLQIIGALCIVTGAAMTLIGGAELELVGLVLVVVGALDVALGWVLARRQAKN